MDTLTTGSFQKATELIASGHAYVCVNVERIPDRLPSTPVAYITVSAFQISCTRPTEGRKRRARLLLLRELKRADRGAESFFFEEDNDELEREFAD